MIKAAGVSLIVLTSSFFANAAEAAQKIGYINTAQVFQALPQREAVMQKMQKDFKGKADELKKIQSEAIRDAERIKGVADAEAASIYADAYDQSAQARSLYDFLKSMETLEVSLNDKTSVVLSTESDLYRYLKGY